MMKKNTQSPLTNRPALSFIVLIVITLFSCKKDGTDSDGNSIRKVRIKDASVLFLTDGQERIGTSSLRMSTGSDIRTEQVNQGLSDVLFKQTRNGDVEPVYFIKENGDSVIMRVSRLHGFSNKYVLLEGDFSLKQETFFYILVNTQTEGIYGLPFYPHELDFQNPKVEEDKDGNLYFAREGRMIYKLNTGDPNNFQIEEYLPQNQSFYDFMVNPDGICFYGNGSVGSSDGYRFKLSSGEIIPVSNLTEKMSSYWVFYGFNGDYYFLRPKNGMLSQEFDICRIDFNANDVSVERITEFYSKSTSGATFIPNKKRRTFFALQGDQIYEFDESAKSIKLYPLTLPNSGWTTSDLKAGFTASHWIVPPRSNGNSIMKLSLSDYSVSVVPLVPEGTYEFYSFTMNPKSNTVSFTGLRYSDGKNVVGSVDEQNNVSITAIEQGKPINLVKLN